MDGVNTSTSQIDSLAPEIIAVRNPYGTGPAFSLEFPVSTQGVNGTIGFKTLFAYFVRIGGAGTRYNLFIDIDNLTAVSVELEGGVYKSYPSNGYGTEDPQVNASGVFVIVKDTTGGRNTLYTIRITGLAPGPPAPTIFPRGTGASSSLQFNPALGGTVQPSLTPVPPLPSNLFQSGVSTPCLVIKCGGQTKSYYPAHRRTDGFSPMIFIEAITAAQNQNFGEVFFTVFDIEPHKGTFNGQTPSFQLGGTTVYASQFSKFPQFNVVVKGDGYTLEEKFLWLIDYYHLLTTIENFTAHMALYSYAKYVLAGLLNCGHFSAKWLSRCYNREFMSLLEDSRFSDFSILFTDREIGLVGFQRYFNCLPDKKEK